MISVLFRILLATSGSAVLCWILYENVWLPFDYERDVALTAERLTVMGQTIEQKFAELDPSEWDRAAQDYNTATDQFLAVIRESRPAWADLYARYQSEAEDGLLVDGYEAFVAILLPDGRTLLRNDILFLSNAGFAYALWLFVAAAVVLGFFLLRWAVAPEQRRLRAIAETADRIADQGGAPPLAVGGDDPIGLVEERVNAVGIAVETMVSDLHESIASQRDLLHAVAHEFRGPIGRMRFAQDMLTDTSSAEDRADLSGKIDRAMDELEELVTEVLGYSRIRHGGYRPDIAPLDLCALVNRTVEKVRQEFPSIRFEAEVDQALEVEADARMLERALINIVRNAGRFAHRDVLVECRPAGTEVVLAVHDDGPGVAPGKRERVFEPFTRLDSSRSRELGGSGLGLAIVKAIALQHGGSVRCADSPEGGALFELRWPRQPQA